jgi:type VI secretion system protein ImpC
MADTNLDQATDLRHQETKDDESSGEFQRLLQKAFRTRTDKAREAVESAVRTLAEQALLDTHRVSDDALSTIEALIARIDEKLSAQINVILHAEAFQKLESAWRGLHYLVTNTESDESLKLRVMNVSKADLHRSLRKYKGVAWDQSPLFKKLYEEEYGQFGGEPYGALVADYYFDNSAPDVDFLTQMGRVSAAAHAPFIAGADPAVMLMDSWQELANPRDLTKIFQTPEHAAWRSLRDSEDSRYIGLAMPRFLARTPYGAKTNPVEAFDFEEDTAPMHRNMRGRTRPMRWRPTSTARSSRGDGARAFAASSRAARWKTCRFTLSRPTMAAWT